MAVVDWTTPPPWPENVYPTGRELAGWLRALPLDEAERACVLLVRAQEQALECIVRHGWDAS
jgi:hypothetical protein